VGNGREEKAGEGKEARRGVELLNLINPSVTTDQHYHNKNLYSNDYTIQKCSLISRYINLRLYTSTIIPTEIYASYTLIA